MSAAEILQMIEEVSPDDTAKLDEIDARVIAYLHEWNADEVIEDYRDTKTADNHYWQNNYKEYTRSRDALKTIRPEGWHVCGHYALATALGYAFTLFRHKDNSGHSVTGVGMIKTEELAELHAIISAIAWERENGK
jgi:regulator of replication initiation timing